MKYQAMKLATGLSILAGATILGAMLAEPVIAQVRAALVKDVDNPARQPFTVNGFAINFPSNTSSLTVDLLAVPAGKRAVIEHVSFIDFLASGNNFVLMQPQFTLGGTTQAMRFVHEFVGGSFISGVDVWSFSQPVRAYADPGTAISMIALRRSTAGSGGIEYELSGHYVDTAL